MSDKIKIWQNNASGDDGAVHSIGNGEMLVCNIGPNIINLALCENEWVSGESC